MADNNRGVFVPFRAEDFQGPFSEALNPEAQQASARAAAPPPAPAAGSGPLSTGAYIAENFLQGARQARIRNFVLQEQERAQKLSSLSSQLQRLAADPDLNASGQQAVAKALNDAMAQHMGADMSQSKGGGKGGGIDTAKHGLPGHFANVLKDMVTNALGGKLPKAGKIPDPDAVVGSVYRTLYDPQSGKLKSEFSRQSEMGSGFQKIEDALKSLPQGATLEQATTAAQPGIDFLRSRGYTQEAEARARDLASRYQAAPQVGTQQWFAQQALKGISTTGGTPPPPSAAPLPAAEKPGAPVAAQPPENPVTDRSTGNIPKDRNNPMAITVGPATKKWLDTGAATIYKTSDGRQFLNFKDADTGFRAGMDLLFHSGNYDGMTVDAALKKWSDRGYGGEIAPGIANLTIAQVKQDPTMMEGLAKSIAKREGFTAPLAAKSETGKEPPLTAPLIPDGLPGGGTPLSAGALSFLSLGGMAQERSVLYPDKDGVPRDMRAYEVSIPGRGNIWYRTDAQGNPMQIDPQKILGDGAASGAEKLRQAVDFYRQQHNVGADVRLTPAGLAKAQKEFAEYMEPDDVKAQRKLTAEMREEQVRRKKEEEEFEGYIAKAIENGTQAPEVSRLYGHTVGVRGKLAKDGYDLMGATLDYQKQMALVKTMSSNNQMRLRQAVNFVDETIGSVQSIQQDIKNGIMTSRGTNKEAEKYITRTGVPFINRQVMNAAKMGAFGDKAKNAAVALDTLIRETQFELAVVYKGGGSPTDKGLAEAQKIVSSDWDEKRLNTALNIVQQALQFRMRSMLNEVPWWNTGAMATTASGKIEVVDDKGVYGPKGMHYMMDADKWPEARRRGLAQAGGSQAEPQQGEPAQQPAGTAAPNPSWTPAGVQ